MNHRLLGVIALAILPILSGCATGSPAGDSHAPPRPLASDIAAFRAPSDPAATGRLPEYREPEGILKLRDALAAALLNNPELAAFSWEVRAREARALQEGRPPNPELSVEIENVGGTGPYEGFESPETTVSLSQLIELGGKRAKRARAAELERDLAGWEYEAERILVLTEVTRRFVHVAALQRKVDLASENADLAGQLLGAAEKRADAGAATSLETMRAGVAVSRARIELRRLKRELETARQELAESWGSANVAFDGVTAPLDAIAEIPPLASLAERLGQNPELARWAAQITQLDAALQVQRARAVPDLTAGAGVRHFSDTGDTAAVFGFSLPLPLFDRNKGGIRAAQYDISKAKEEERATQLRVHAGLVRAYQSLSSAHDEAKSLRDEALPAASAAFEAARKAYEPGEVSSLEVLDARRTLVEVQQQFIDALASYHSAVAELEALIGDSLQGSAAGASPPVKGEDR